MRIAFYGMAFETLRVTIYLWSPWRASALEHRLFEAFRELPRVEQEDHPDGWRLHITDAKTWQTALQTAERVLKGWQEDADPGREKRSWRWLLEGDTDADGFDHSGEVASLWSFLRVSLDRTEPGEQDKGEDIELDDFCIRIGNANEERL